MFRLLVVVVVVVCVSVTDATTCIDCKSTYDTATKTTDDDTCTAWKAYVACLETSDLTDAGCPLKSIEAAAVTADHDAIEASCALTDLDACSCQKTFWGTDQTSTSGKCIAMAVYLQCLAAASTNGCGDETPAALLTTGTADLVETECGSGAGQVLATSSLVLSLLAATLM